MYPTPPEHGTATGFQQARRAYFTRQIAGWWWLLGLAGTTLFFDLLRVEAYETPRAAFSTLIGIGIILSILVVPRNYPNIRRCLRQPLVVAVLIWSLCLVVSAVFSLTPIRSLLGDLQRRMGALTQLSLVAAFFGGILLTARQRAQANNLLIVVSMIAIGYAALEKVGYPPFLPGNVDRLSSIFGIPPFAGNWTVIVAVWLLTRVFAGWTHHTVPWGLTVLCCCEVIGLLVLTGTRSALLGLGVGILILAVVWSATHGRRYVAVVLVVCAVTSVGGGLAIYSGGIHLDIHNTILADLPIMQRIADMPNDRSSLLRLAVWRNVGVTIHDWPVMLTIDNHPDSLGAIRPLIGYGQETFADVLRRGIDNRLQRLLYPGEFFDRAHNLLLDTLTSQGILGMAGLTAVYAAAVWTSLRMLKQQGKVWSERGWMAAASLAIVVAHFVDLQFGFASLPGEWLFWGILGILQGAALRHAPRRFLPTAQPDHLISPVSIWIFVWSLGSQIGVIRLIPGALIVVTIFFILLVFGPFITSRMATHRDQHGILIVTGFLALAVLLQRQIAIFLANALDRLNVEAMRGLLLLNYGFVWLAVMLCVLVGMWRSRRWLMHRSSVWIAALVLVLTGAWLTLDAAASSMALLTRRLPIQAQSDLSLASAKLNPLDDRLAGQAGESALSAILDVPGNTQQTLLANAEHLLNQAAALNPYDADTAVDRANVLVYQALRQPDAAERLTQLETADNYFAVAVQQWPANGGIWLAWTNFALRVRNQPDRAIQIIQQANQHVPNLPGSERLIGDITLSLWQQRPDPALLTQAAEAYRQAISTNRRDIAAALALADLLTRQGELSEARIVLQNAYSHSTRIGQRAQVTAALVPLLEANGGDVMARRYIERVLPLPINESVRTQLLLARARLRRRS